MSHAIPAFVGEGYSGRDVQALGHFVTFTAGDLIGSQGLWTQDGVQLALSVCNVSSGERLQLIILAE